LKRIRVLVFSDPNVSSIAEALSPFASVKKVNWQYRHIPDSARYIPLKMLYRTAEGLYWVLQIIREAYLFQADIILAQFAYFSGLIGAVAAKLSGKLFVIRIVGSDLKVRSQFLMGRVVTLLTLRVASGVICVSKDLENGAKKLGSRSTVVIPSPLLLPLNNETNVNEEKRQIVSVARLIPIKGMSYLIRAMTHLKEGSLVIIGDGPERKKLELLSRRLGLRDRVFFSGWVSDRSKISTYLSQATVFVLPSLSEGLPRVLVEAMACGLPVIATDVGGVPEVVVDGINGLLVPPRDEKALAKAIEYVFNEVDFRRRASIENLKASTEYLPTNVGQKINAYLKKILKDKNCGTCKIE
jgi:glycosyltransferase involved in cell wall biosynthesis